MKSDIEKDIELMDAFLELSSDKKRFKQALQKRKDRSAKIKRESDAIREKYGKSININITM